MNFEPAVMRKLERWSKEENEEEFMVKQMILQMHTTRCCRESEMIIQMLKLYV